MRKRLLIALAAAAMLTLIPSLAWAHHPEIEASLDCDGVLTFKATAWAGDAQDPAKLELQRTNPDIRVTAFFEGDEAHAVQIGTGAFNKENDFSFGGTREVGVTDKVIIVKATAHANWGNGVAPGKPSTTKVYPPKDCPPASSSSTSSSSTSSSSTSSSSSSSSSSTSSSTTSSSSTSTTQPQQSSTSAPTTTTGGGALPFTGAGAAPLLLSLGAGLVVAGGAAVFIARRRAEGNG